MINMELRNSGREMQNQPINWVESMPRRETIARHSSLDSVFSFPSELLLRGGEEVHMLLKFRIRGDIGIGSRFSNVLKVLHSHSLRE